MTALLLLGILGAADFPQSQFFADAVPGLARMTIGTTPLLEDHKTFALGVEGIVTEFPLFPHSQVNPEPSFGAYYCYAFENPLRSYVFLRGNLYPRHSYTLSTVPGLSAGLGIRPKQLRNLGFRLAYGMLGKAEFYPGDPYYNYQFRQFHTVGLDVSARARLGKVTGQVVVGGSLSLFDGWFRQDLGQVFLPYSSPQLGWWAEAALRLGIVKFTAGLANQHLTVAAGLQLSL